MEASDPNSPEYAVAGGILDHETFGGETRPILALHGISSTRKLWLWLHEVAPELTLLAPDLRGRGESLHHGRVRSGIGGHSATASPNAHETTGRSATASRTTRETTARNATASRTARGTTTYGIDAHVGDLIDLLNLIGVRRVHVVGVSLGAFVGVRLARTHPGRVSSLTLIDGGPPMTLPPELTAQVLPQVFGGRLARLGRPWDSLEAYRDYFCGEVAPLLAPDDPLLLQYLAHDLDAAGMVRLDSSALLADAEDVYFGGHDWRDVQTPMHLLHAQWSLGADSVPAYEPADIAAVEAAGVRTTLVRGVDHAASIMTRHGASHVAAVLRQADRGSTA